MLNKTDVEIREIDHKIAMSLVVENHYLHRKSPCSYAFGLFKNDGLFSELLGVITYGIPASRPLQRGICGDEEADNVIELTRLWLKDEAPKNCESYLISNSMKLVDKEIIVSFAEIAQGHLGIVYQATNWLYTGLSQKRVDWAIVGRKNKHIRHIMDLYGSIEEAKSILGKNLIRKERPRKHRYIYFNTNKKRKKELLNKLLYKVEKYPKK
tara:strand:+ start:132 stop:764 length:633 start_codon:yes stop_codon:yes gene_type:complete